MKARTSMYHPLFFTLCLVHLFWHNQGSYLQFGTYVAPASDFEGDCKIKCNPKAYLINRTQTYNVTYEALILEQYGDAEEITKSIQELKDRGGRENYLLSQYFTRTWTSHQCQICPDVFDFHNKSVDRAFYTMDADCNPTCHEANSYYNIESHPGKCIKCDLTSCDRGTYLEGQNCTKCSSCVKPIQDNWEFTSHGSILDNNQSCDGQCSEGYFEDIVFNLSSSSLESVCIPHQEIDCNSGEYKVVGTKKTDAYCEACGECEGMNKTQQCSDSENAVCEPCKPQELERGAFYVYENCTRACLSGYIEDKRRGECEECAHECPEGQMFSPSRQNCTDCQTCDVDMPPNARFVQDCEWECQEGYALENRTCQQEKILTPSLDEGDSVVQCEPGQQLDCHPETSICECLNCNEKKDILTPPMNQFGISWLWIPTRSKCTWECNPSFYYIQINNNTVDCVDWNSLLQRAHVTTIDVNDFDDIVLQRHKVRQNKIPFTELIIFMATVTTTIIFLICSQ